MNAARLKRLEAEWAAKLRADGFVDIEAPGGMVPSVLSHGVSPARVRLLAQLEADREATPRLRFSEEWERKAWALHLEGVSNRQIAVRMCIYRKMVNEAFMRLRWQMEKPRPGRKRDPESLRSHGMVANLMLTPAAALALDHLHAALKVSKAEAVRMAVIKLAKETQGSGANPPYSRMSKAA
jgi:hypothetical protein